MRVTVELTYAIAKALGERALVLEDARTVGDVVAAIRARFGPGRLDERDRLLAGVAVAVNGVLASHRRGSATRLEDGDLVTLVQSTAGG